jgi:hypothetical protein
VSANLPGFCGNPKALRFFYLFLVGEEEEIKEDFF